MTFFFFMLPDCCGSRRYLSREAATLVEEEARDCCRHTWKVMGTILRSKLLCTSLVAIEYEVMTVQFFFFFAFQHFEYHVLVEHDKKPPQPKFGGNLFMGARDMVT